MYWYGLSEEEKEKAICYLIDKIPKDIFEKVWRDIQTKGKDWWLKHHYDFGMWVRNKLREGKIITDCSVELDDVWDLLVEEATRRVLNLPSSVVMPCISQVEKFQELCRREMEPLKDK